MKPSPPLPPAPPQFPPPPPPTVLLEDSMASCRLLTSTRCSGSSQEWQGPCLSPPFPCVRHACVLQQLMDMGLCPLAPCGLLWTACRSWLEHLFSVLSGTRSGVRVLGHAVTVSLRNGPASS